MPAPVIPCVACGSTELTPPQPTCTACDSTHIIALECRPATGTGPAEYLRWCDNCGADESKIEVRRHCCYCGAVQPEEDELSQQPTNQEKQ